LTSGWSSTGRLEPNRFSLKEANQRLATLIEREGTAHEISSGSDLCE
jgi:hypothetical protein